MSNISIDLSKEPLDLTPELIRATNHFHKEHASIHEEKKECPWAVESRYIGRADLRVINANGAEFISVKTGLSAAVIVRTSGALPNGFNSIFSYEEPPCIHVDIWRSFVYLVAKQLGAKDVAFLIDETDETVMRIYNKTHEHPDESKSKD
jgi:hypothetical protein